MEQVDSSLGGDGDINKGYNIRELYGDGIVLHFFYGGS